MSTAETIDDIFRAEPGTPYQPSNGTEGDCFYCSFCEHCERDAQYSDDTPELGCQILADTFAFNVDDPRYPKEWVYDKDGLPTCTAYTKIGAYRCNKTVDMFEDHR